MLLVAPVAGVKVPAPALKTPPIPPVRDQTPPDCSPVIKVFKFINATLLSQIVAEPSNPASGSALIFTVAILLELTQGATPSNSYLNVLLLAPAPGVNVPPAALNVPPNPPVLVQTPPVCSPVINKNKSIGVVLLSQIVVLPLLPAIGCALMLTVATLKSSTHGATPNFLYSKVLFVAPEAGVKVPAPALKVPPNPPVLVQTPPDCSPVINKNKSIGVVLLSQTMVDPFDPASG